jgi:hypothetical protein
MRSIGPQELIVVLLVIVVPCVSIWFAMKATPLGGRPYRWGTYVGLSHGLMALVSCFLGVVQHDGGMMVFGAWNALVSFGILDRRRLGVVVLLVPCVPFAILAPLFALTDPKFAIFENIQTLIFLKPIIVANTIYFMMRWTFMRPKYDPSRLATTFPVSGDESR